MLTSGTSNKNQGWHLVDPVIDRCERKEPCFRRLLSYVFLDRKPCSERIIIFKEYFTGQWKFLKIGSGEILSSLNMYDFLILVHMFMKDVTKYVKYLVEYLAHIR